MKLGPVTKLDNRNKSTSKKFYNGVMTANCDVIVIFLIYGQFGAIQKLDSGWSVKLTFSLKVTFYLAKTENRTKNLKHNSHNIALSKGTIFAKKCSLFAKKF